MKRTLGRQETQMLAYLQMRKQGEVAIRDFYDIDYAVRKLGLQPQDQEMVRLVSRKLDVPGHESVDLSGERLAALRQQVEPQLKPVLRVEDFREFDLERVFRTVVEMAKRLGEQRNRVAS